MTSLDFQSLLKQEKEKARKKPQQLGQKINETTEPPMGAAAPGPAACYAEKPTKQGNNEDASPWFVELAERPLLEMEKVGSLCSYHLLC